MSEQPPVASGESRAQLRQMLLIGLVASILGIALALLIDWFPVPASEQAGPIDTLWDVLLIASVPVFVLVETIVLYCAIKFRMRPGEELRDGPPIHGNTKLEVIWTAIPAILLVGLCTYAYVVLTDIEDEAAASETLNVRVVGEQFTWTFYYEGEGGDEVASPQLYLPPNTPVDFTVQSRM
jgi:cytochrome c oxidase subunit 2